MKTQTSNSSTSLHRSPSIQEVATALGMSKSTVSIGLSGKGQLSPKTRERIVTVAKEMGYRPNPLAQRLATNAANHQVVLCARTLDTGITTEKLLLIQRELTAHGLEVPIYSLSNDGQGREEHQAHQMRQLCRQQPRAIVCSAQAIHESAFPELDCYRQRGGIVVTYDVPTPLSCDQVIFDREDNAYQAARTLIGAGHRHLGIALVSPRHENGQMYFNQDARLRGFRRALEEAGLELRTEWVFEAGSGETGGDALATDFLALKKQPTGLCIVNDYLAFGFMVTVMRAGLRLPDDLSIIGHDNQMIAAHCPVPLTCITQPKVEIARAVCQLLLERLNGSQRTPQTIHVRGEVVLRQSITQPQI